jgi:hypothetical protein
VPSSPAEKYVVAVRMKAGPFEIDEKSESKISLSQTRQGFGTASQGMGRRVE